MVNKTWNGIEFVYDFVSNVATSFIDKGVFKLVINGHSIEVFNMYGVNVLIIDDCSVAIRDDNKIYIHTTNCSYDIDEDYKFFNPFIKLVCGELFRKSFMYGLKVEAVYDHVQNVLEKSFNR